jgi:TPR repeat protein
MCVCVCVCVCACDSACVLTAVLRYMIGYFEDCGRRKVGAGGALWYSLAAAQGHGQAQLSLALHLLRGSGGVSADRKEAVKWLEQAAAQGVAEAVRRLRALEEGGDAHAAGAGLRLAAARGR